MAVARQGTDTFSAARRRLPGHRPQQSSRYLAEKVSVPLPPCRT